METTEIIVCQTNSPQDTNNNYLLNALSAIADINATPQHGYRLVPILLTLAPDKEIPPKKHNAQLYITNHMPLAKQISPTHAAAHVLFISKEHTQSTIQQAILAFVQHNTASLPDEPLAQKLIVDLPDVVLMINRAYRICYINHAFLHLQPRDAIGKSIFEFDTSAEQQQEAQTKIQHVFETGNKQNYERQATHNSQQLHLLFRIRPHLTAGKTQQLVLIVSDITHRKTLEESLSQRKHQLITAQQVAQIGHFELNTASGHWNSSKELDRILGLGEQPSQSLQDIFVRTHSAFRQELKHHIEQEVLQERKPLHKEFVIIETQTNTERWIQVKGRLKAGNPKLPPKLFGTLQDITQRKVAELTLSRSELATKRIIELTSGKQGQEYFEDLTRALEEVTQADYSFIGECTNTAHIKTIACCQNGAIQENLRYKIAGSPFAKLNTETTCIYTSKLNEHFPNDEFLRAENILALAGTKVYNHHKQAIGVIVSLYRKPIQHTAFVRSIFELFSRNVAGEMERIKAKKALKESEEKHRLLFENASLGISYFTPDGYTIDLNKKAQEGLQLKLNAYRGKHISEIFGEHKGIQFMQRIKQACLSLEAETYEDVLNLPAGEKYFLSTINAIPNPNGKINGVQLIHQDISDIKKTENALRKSETELSAIYENAPLMMLVMDKNRKVKQANKLALKMANLEINEAIGVGQGKILGCLYADEENLSESACELCEISALVNLTFRTRKTVYRQEIEFKLNNKKINKIHLLISTTYLLIENEDHVLVCLEDISERKQTELALKAERQRARNIIHGTNAGTWEWDTQTGEVQVNTRWTEMIGYTKPEMPTIDIYAWKKNIHPEDLMSVKKMLAKTFTKQIDYFDSQHREKHKNGHWVWVNARGKVMEWSDNGKALRMSGTRLDITKRKQAEISLKEQNVEYEAMNEELTQINHELLSAKERAEEHNRLKTSFLQNMSHELRTPMNGIIGFSQMLNKPNLNAEQRSYFTQIITDSSNQLLSVVNDILDISKIETGQIELKIEVFNLNDLILELFSFYKPQLTGSNVALFTHTPLPNAHSEIKADKTKVRQVLSNLLNNAAKFTNQGHIRFGYTINQNFVEFFVEDTGIGIATEAHKLIFERFRQASKDTSQNYGGTGLGLSICKGFAEVMDGDIWLKSTVGNGSTFFFTIPYCPTQTVQQHNTYSTNYTKAIPTVLIAEDESINFLFLKESILLELSDDIEILHAKNGKEAVEFCNNNPDIQLVLMDIKMPILNGIEATQAIKSSRPQLPIVAQTAYALAEDKDAALKNGFDGYLSKPVKIDDLVELVKSYLFV